VTQHQKVDEDNEGDDDLLRGEDPNAKIEMDFLGGEGGDPETEDEDLQSAAYERPKVVFQLAELQALLSRSEEISRARQPGRHRETDVHSWPYSTTHVQRHSHRPPT